MQQFLAVWGNMQTKQRLIAASATVAVFLGLASLSVFAARPDFQLLYSGLAPDAAGEVIAALDAEGVEYDIRGSAIFVPSERRDQLRMALAADGLPANTVSGYELLDSLSGFGTTSQMFDAAYWRAKEGELARTILASGQISAARVHIANPSSSPFARDIAASASATITSRAGKLAPAQAKAYRYLIASAVAGIAAEDVTIIDGATGVVLDTGSETGTEDQDGRAAQLKSNVEHLMEARVGAGNAVVEVTVETINERESIVERRFDPDSRVAISSDTEERSSSSQDEQNGVSVASNLPDGDAANGGESRSNTSETRERINYEVSETRRELERGPGAIKRITVAVLVNQVVAPDTGEITARSEEELSAFRDLVAAAVGYDEARGDRITIKSMNFSAPAVVGTEAALGTSDWLRVNALTLIQIAVLAVVTLILALFVVRPMLLPRRIELPAPDTPALDGDIQPRVALDERAEVLPAPMIEEKDRQDHLDRLRNLVEKRRDESAALIRTWIETPEEDPS